MTGEALGASGALQALTALETMRTGRLPGVAGLHSSIRPAIRDRPPPPSRGRSRAANALVTAIDAAKATAARSSSRRN